MNQRVRERGLRQSGGRRSIPLHHGFYIGLPSFSDENNPAESPSSAKLTTWSNLGTKQRSESYTQHEAAERHRSKFKEENHLNNNTAAGESRKSRSLPDMGRGHRAAGATAGAVAAAAAAAPIPISQNNRLDGSETTTPTESKLVTAFMKNREAEPRAANWEEELQTGAAGGGPIPMMRSKDTVNQFLKTASRLTSIDETSGELGSGQSSSAASPLEAKAGMGAAAAAHRHSRKSSGFFSATTTPSNASASSKPYPDLNFLENDVGLWDAFFLHSKHASKYQSVLKQHPMPPLPVENYLQKQPRGRHSLIQDSDSLRTLLPTAQKHLLPSADATPTSSSARQALETHRSSPISQVCQSLSKLNTGPIHHSHDLQNEAIKSMFQQQQNNLESGAPNVQVVKVKEAWTDVPEKEQVVVRRRRKTGEERNLNLINNNGDEEDYSAKRRSFHPQDHISKAFDTSQRPSRKPAEFPKVSFLCEIRLLYDPAVKLPA